MKKNDNDNVSKNDKTLKASLARMIAIDGTPFSTFVTFMDLRDVLKAEETETVQFNIR